MMCQQFLPLGTLPLSPLPSSTGTSGCSGHGLTVADAAALFMLNLWLDCAGVALVAHNWPPEHWQTLGLGPGPARSGSGSSSGPTNDSSGSGGCRSMSGTLIFCARPDQQQWQQQQGQRAGERERAPQGLVSASAKDR